jgi:hypothetical protein
MYERTHALVNGTVVTYPRPYKGLPDQEFAYINPAYEKEVEEKRKRDIC